jgi:hypothetical protein
MPNTLTPNPADAFSRFFAASFDEKSVVSVPTAFQAFFGRREAGGSQTFWTEDALTVDIDIIRAAGETHAALVHRGTDSRRLGDDKKSLNVEKYTAESRVFPLIEDEGELAASKLLLRNAGENPYARTSRINRMRDRAMKIFEESIRRIMRAREVLAAESILTGKMSAIFGTSSGDLQYDFKRTSALNWEVSNSWSSTSATILADIDNSCNLIRQYGYVWPNFIGMGGADMNSFINSEDVRSVADNRRFELIWVNQNMPVPPKYAPFVEAGWLARGRLRTPGGHELWMFTNDEVYTNLAGSTTRYLPDNNVIVANIDARMDRYMGPPERLPMTPSDIAYFTELFGMSPGGMSAPPNIKGASRNFIPQHFYFDCYKATNQKALTCRVQHAPIFATTQTDTISVIDTTASS